MSMFEETTIRKGKASNKDFELVYCFDRRTSRLYWVEMDQKDSFALRRTQMYLGCFNEIFLFSSAQNLSESEFFDLLPDPRSELNERIEIKQKFIPSHNYDLVDSIKSEIQVLQETLALFESHYKEKESKNDE